MLLSAAGRAEHASAQTPLLTVNVAGFSAEAWPSAQAVVTVQDSQGHALAGLTASDFQAQLNGSPVSLTSVSRAVDSSVPVAVVLALDTSETMNGVALEQAKTAAHGFLDGLEPQDTVAVLAFNDKLDLIQPFTHDRAAAGGVIDRLVASGKTSLYEATAESVRLAALADSSRRVVVLLSDGQDNASALPRAEALATAKALGVPVFGIALGLDIDHSYLRELAEASGGQFAETPSPEGLAQLYRDVGDVLRGQYVLSFDAAGLGLARSDVATLRIDVTANGTAGGGDRLVCPQAICISLADLQDGQRVESARAVTARVVAQDAVASVTFLVDGQSVQEKSSPPYQFTLDPAAYSGGGHTFSVQAKSASGSTETRELSLQLGAAAGGSAVSPALLSVAALILVAVVGIGWFFFRRRGRHERGIRPMAPSPAPLTPATGVIVSRRLADDFEPGPAPTIDEAMGLLRAVGGPLKGEAFAVGGAPVSIGSGLRCPIRLEEIADGAEIPSEYARVWVRDGKLMVHEVKRLTVVGAVGGRWEILGEGDMFSLGPYTFQFELEGTSSEAAHTNGAPDEPAAAPEAGVAVPAAAVGSATQAAGPFDQSPEEPALIPDIFRDPPKQSAPDFEESSSPPNIFRDRSPTPGAASDELLSPTPNVLRERPSDAPDEAAQPAEDDLDLPPPSEDDFADGPYPELPLG